MQVIERGEQVTVEIDRGACADRVEIRPRRSVVDQRAMNRVGSPMNAESVDMSVEERDRSWQ